MVAKKYARRRCRARRGDGERCRAWACERSLAQGEGRPLCIMHVGPFWRLPDGADRAAGRGCTARTRQGERCRQWAVKGSDPPLCRNHGGMACRVPEERQRCRATKSDGSRCRNWAWRKGPEGEEATLCNVHGGRMGWRGPARGARRCRARNAQGERCSRWALREEPGSEGEGGTLCELHAVRRSLGPPEERRCTATTLDGERCELWVLGSDGEGEEGPALCHFHAHPGQHPQISHGFYRRIPWFSETEALFIRACLRAGHPLTLQVVIMRLKLRGLIAYLNRPDLEPAERVRVSQLILHGCEIVTRLLLARRKCVGVWSVEYEGVVPKKVRLATLEVNDG